MHLNTPISCVKSCMSIEGNKNKETKKLALSEYNRDHDNRKMTGEAWCYCSDLENTAYGVI